MTNRLYYDDAYLLEFDAHITAADVRDGRSIVTLDRSAFYPTSGGQPYDTGTLGGLRVTDVFVDKDGEVWHEIDGELAVGDAVHGSIDRERRLDHMQQHGGEHMIAGAFYALTGGMTIGLHLGEKVSSIDVEFKDGSTHASPELIRSVEDWVNERIRMDAPVRCWFPDEAELAALPLRKAPTVTSHVRIVAMGDFEMVACGGTHPSSTGQIGVVKIVETAPAKGKLRVSFVCGKRAAEDYRMCFDTAWAAANLLSTRPEELVRSVGALQERAKNAEHALAVLKREKLLGSAEAMLEGAESINGGRLVTGVFDEDVALVRDLASSLIKNDDVAVLLAARAGERLNYIFARGNGLDWPMGRLLSAAAKPLGGKGGGRDDFAQGGGPEGIIEAAKAILAEGQL